jgi:hypothetical protein
MLTYAELYSSRRKDFFFRGQGDSNHPLETTLDRKVGFDTPEEREAWISQSREVFKTELIQLSDPGSRTPEGEALDLLARHHGLPSSLLDWSESPWIAAYFAYSSVDDKAQRVAVWRLDRARVPESAPVSFIDQPDLLRFNRRALMQRAVFLSVDRLEPTLETSLAPALIVYEISVADRVTALCELDEMGINATRLFADVSGVCQTVWDRMYLELPRHK